MAMLRGCLRLETCNQRPTQRKTKDMHHSVINFIDKVLTTGMVHNKRVLEVGSLDVNGSVKPLVMGFGPASYIGVDMREGPGVDRVVDACELAATFGDESFDLVISTEMLEHVEHWRLAVNNMKRVLRPGGTLLITTRSEGFPLHEYPGDFWRFSLSDAARIFADMEHVSIAADPQAPGIFVCATKRMQEDHQITVDLSAIKLFSMLTGTRE
jgi:SAM-dependent methyltransferase